MDKPAPRTVSINHAATLVGVSRRTIYNWIAAGKVRVYRLPSGRPRIGVDSLLSSDTADDAGRPVSTLAQGAD